MQIFSLNESRVCTNEWEIYLNNSRCFITFSPFLSMINVRHIFISLNVFFTLNRGINCVKLIYYCVRFNQNVAFDALTFHNRLFSVYCKLHFTKCNQHSTQNQRKPVSGEKRRSKKLKTQKNARTVYLIYKWWKLCNGHWNSVRTNFTLALFNFERKH